jgi:hypothetical protein
MTSPAKSADVSFKKNNLQTVCGFQILKTLNNIIFPLFTLDDGFSNLKQGDTQCYKAQKSAVLASVCRKG